MTGHEGRIEANGIEIAYETFGERTATPLLLVMGLGTQMIAWPDAFCGELASRGYFVVRFDNRDAGLSTHLHGVRAPRPVEVLLGRRKPPYRISDMAEDGIGLLDALGLESVHLVGASMGGFIAQTMALAHPQRLRSLTLMMTSTGSRWVGRSQPKLTMRLLRGRPVADRDGVLDAAVETFRLIGSPGYPFDETRLRELAGRAYDRSYDPGGYLRQLSAVLGQSDRTQALHGLQIPTLILHGLADPLVSVSGGRALARAIPGARFVGLPGMGHDLPSALWSRFVEEISTIAGSADASAKAVPH
ncbi:MAG TPA: alpha/beta hydrolase [Mycobacteriales bacterium]|nr:alpha/beta hydrolase [Mycobacteriales bacterium]